MKHLVDSFMLLDFLLNWPVVLLSGLSSDVVLYFKARVEFPSGNIFHTRVVEIQVSGRKCWCAVLTWGRTGCESFSRLLRHSTTCRKKLWHLCGEFVHPPSHFLYIFSCDGFVVAKCVFKVTRRKQTHTMGERIHHIGCKCQLSNVRILYTMCHTHLSF